MYYTATVQRKYIWKAWHLRKSHHDNILLRGRDTESF